jgi:hypothetical protein
MSGPTLLIELAEPLSPTALREFRALVVGLSSPFEDEHADEPEVETVLDFRPSHWTDRPWSSPPFRDCRESRTTPGYPWERQSSYAPGPNTPTFRLLK